MADEKFYFSSGEILMKGVFLIFIFLGEGTSYMMVSYSVLKKEGKRNVKFRRRSTLNTYRHAPLVMITIALSALLVLSLWTFSPALFPM